MPRDPTLEPRIEEAKVAKAAPSGQENPLGPELFRFLKDLKANNERAWFQEH